MIIMRSLTDAPIQRLPYFRFDLARTETTASQASTILPVTTFSPYSPIAMICPCWSTLLKVHCGFISAPSMPTGFKTAQMAQHPSPSTLAVLIAHLRSSSPSTKKESRSPIIKTEPNVQVILRGGNSGPNYERQWVEKCTASLKNGGVVARFMLRWLIYTPTAVIHVFNRLTALMETGSSRERGYRLVLGWGDKWSVGNNCIDFRMKALIS